MPAAILIGIDLSEHVKRVLVLTRSQKENERTAEEKDEIPVEIMTDNSDPAELIQLSNPQNNTFTQEQKADSTLKCCFGKVSVGPVPTVTLGGEDPTAESVLMERPIENSFKRKQSTVRIPCCISVLSLMVKGS